MRDVYEAIFDDDYKAALAVKDLPEERKTALFTPTEFLNEVRKEAYKEFAYLPRKERRAEVRKALKRAKRQIRAENSGIKPDADVI